MKQVSVETSLSPPIHAHVSNQQNSPHVNPSSNMGNLRLGSRDNVLQRARQRLQLLRLLNAFCLLQRMVQVPCIPNSYFHHHKNDFDGGVAVSK